MTYSFWMNLALCRFTKIDLVPLPFDLEVLRAEQRLRYALSGTKSPKLISLAQQIK